jgi:hypothetical protein
VEELTRALLRLHDDPPLGAALRARALHHWASTHSVEAAVRAYAAAIRLTAAQRSARDGDWLDGASAAVATMAGEPDGRVISEWARLRLAARGVSAAR